MWEYGEQRPLNTTTSVNNRFTVNGAARASGRPKEMKEAAGRCMILANQTYGMTLNSVEWDNPKTFGSFLL